MKEINKKLEKQCIGSCTKSVRNDLSNGNMIFTEESSRAVCEMGKMELIELIQTSATIQCPSCLKHVPEGLNMCQSGVWLRPKQSTMDRIRTAFAALKKSLLPCLSKHFKRKEKWSQPTATRASKSHGCKKRSTETWQTPTLYWTDGRTTKYTERLNWYTVGLTSGSSASTTSPRLTSFMMHTVYMRGVDSNKQAGPLCQRPDYKSSANALVSLQRAQGKGVPQIPMHLRTRQNNTLDPAVQQHSEWFSYNWKTHFSSSSSSTWTESPTWWSSLSWDHQWKDWHSHGVARQRVVGSAITTTTPE